MSSERRAPALLLAAAALLLPACADFQRGPASPPAVADAGAPADAGTSDGAALSFATAVYPILLPACGRCHMPNQEAGDTALLFTGDATADYGEVSRFVDTASPAGSRLLAKMSGHGHGGGTVFAMGSPEYLTVLDWVQQGASP